MTLDNVYKNTIAFQSNGNIELNFMDNKSETRYLFDIIIDNNVMINNIFSIGTHKSVGTVINSSNNFFGISLDSVKITLVLSGSHTIQVKIKQGIFSGMRNDVVAPNNYYLILVGYSFGLNGLMMTETQNNYYQNNLFSPFNTTVLTDINSLLHPVEEIDDLYEPFSHNNTNYPKFAYVDKLVADGTESLKNKDIGTLIEDASIPNALFVNSSISKDKLESAVRGSMALADSSLQNIFINSKTTPETKTNGVINLNLSEAVKSIKKNGTEYYTYEVDGGTVTINYDEIDVQSKILNSHDDGEDYFVSYLTNGEYSFEAMNTFFKKENNIK
jgi:hypothetical protein